MPNHGPDYASHKFNKKSGLRYEICLNIQTADVVWIHGPFPCGKWPDINIFREALMHHLDNGERVEADDGYVGEHPMHIKCPKGFANGEETLYMQQRVRSRQETINNNLKFWGILREVYTQDMVKHGDVVRAILITKQIAINQGETLFQCGYKDPPFDNNDEEDDGDDECEYEEDQDDEEEEGVMEIDDADL